VFDKYKNRVNLILYNKQIDLLSFANLFEWWST